MIVALKTGLLIGVLWFIFHKASRFIFPERTMAKARKPSQKTTLKPAKARQILREGEVGGKPITKKQKGFFGAVAGKAKKK